VLIFATIGMAWVTVRALAQANAIGRTRTDGTGQPAGGEPAGRQLLRIGFGIIWLFDGILQAQPKMAIGLPSLVIEPTAATSPHWVQAVVNWAGTTWSYHPLQAGAAAVWIQAGIGIWLLAAPRGSLSRLAGLVSVGWGLVVWVFGESFGGIFAPGLTWLFGAPGAVLIYCVAGGLVALPERAWNSPRLGRAILAGTGLFLVGMAVLQAWPGRGFWQGVTRGQPGTLAGMTQAMAGTTQPRFLSSLVTSFTSFDEAHGFAVNLAAVTALAVIGALFLSGRARLIRPAMIAFTVLCLADWVLIEDLGFLGGLGTDPNSMVPMILLAAGGYLALTRVPAPASEPAIESAREAAGWRGVLRPANMRGGLARASFGSLVTVGAVGLILLGAAPMAVAQANPNADPILAQAITGASAPLRTPAPGFRLTDQNGRTVTLASLRGKVVLLGFFDPVCTSDCPLMGQEFRQAAELLRGEAARVELVGIVLSPSYRSIPVLRAFDQQEGLNAVPNWRYLTGNLTQLRAVWAHYGMVAEDLPAGAMTLHNDITFVIDAQGRIRQDINSDPGPGTTATRSSFAVLFANAVRQVLR
jgi:cytochrome oxidase Cu insertion factor (SCO1/SenC/PrrC family)